MKKKQKIDLKTIAWKSMEKYGFRPHFSHKVVKETESLIPAQLSGGMRHTRDLRNLLWSSIDNFDSLDLDQIEYCERGVNDEIHVKVAIADVDYYVPKNSEIDRQAGYNGTSVYTGIVTFPMLPDRLSKGISSLFPHEERLAIVIEYTVFPDGSTSYGEIYRAIVTNKAKLIYEEIGDWLEGSTPVPDSVSNIPGLTKQLLLQNEAAQLLRKRRRAQGALDLETLEAQIETIEDTVVDIYVQRQNLARCLIEEFMVASNETIVNFLEKAKLPMIQRIVRIPKYWEEIRGVAATYGEILPTEPDAKSLSKFLTKRREIDPELFPDLSLTIVKLMGSGEYVAYVPGRIPVGHFALAVTDYTHGTAPNRRYVDLVIQRLVKSVLEDKKSPYRLKELGELADWLSDREKESKKVERFMLKSSAAMLLMDRIGETFDAIVTGASEKGIYVRLMAIPVEGRVMQHEIGLKVGQKVMVRLLKTDPYNGHIDFSREG